MVTFPHHSGEVSVEYISRSIDVIICKWKIVVVNLENGTMERAIERILGESGSGGMERNGKKIN